MWSNSSPIATQIIIVLSSYTKKKLTLKNAAVDPSRLAPYLMTFWFAKSSTDLMGEDMLSMVRKAAKLAVYEETMMSVKNHQMPATMRVDTAVGAMSEPCCIREPIVNQNEFFSEN